MLVYYIELDIIKKCQSGKKMTLRQSPILSQSTSPYLAIQSRAWKIDDAVYITLTQVLCV
jgi:hypothetical protein